MQAPRLGGQSVAEGDPLEPPERLLALDVRDLRFGLGSTWVQIARRRWMAWVRSETDWRRKVSSSAIARTSSGSSALPSWSRLRRTTWAIASASPGSLLPGPECGDRDACARPAR